MVLHVENLRYSCEGCSSVGASMRIVTLISLLITFAFSGMGYLAFAGDSPAEDRLIAKTAPKSLATPPGKAPRAIGTIAPSLIFRESQVAIGSIGLRDLASGAIEISGVARPAKAAFLYWAVITKGPPPAHAKSLEIERVLPSRSGIATITGMAIGSGAGPCGTMLNGGDTLTVYRGAVPVGIADGDGYYITRLEPGAGGSVGGEDPLISSPLPAWNDAALVIIGTGGGTVGLYDSGLAGRSIVNDAGVDYALSLGADFRDTPRMTLHSSGGDRWRERGAATGNDAHPALKRAGGNSTFTSQGPRMALNASRRWPMPSPL